MTSVSDIPTGAIENGRVFLQRLADHYDFNCEAGSLANCTDYHEAVRCFEFIAQWISDLSATEPSAARQLALEEEEFAIDKLRFRAFHTNSDADRQAYFDAVSKWFQDRHTRRMDAESERLRFEGDLDKWMKIIGAGITGYQPEAYTLMDLACDELVKLRAENASLRAALSSPDHADSSKSTSDQKVCQTCNDRGIIGGMHRVGDGDVDAWEETCPDCQKVKAHHSDADTGADDLVQIALHLNCEPDADSILHVIREIQADIDIAKHADAGKVEGDDGRPCSMDEFMAALFNEKVDEFDVSEAAASWLHGDWKDALSYLTDVPTHWRPLPSAPSGGDRHGE
ncbi:hypothetical protein [Ochrobactrum sp. 3-3]|uniref:hypothetical protein n=1 Tax=Ochrobactrum sp. 3-3 TaxID=1830124 RepID=UPI000DEEF448|nr:hypothetical protein [Ochrobactrum sp. 3-3]